MESPTYRNIALVYTKRARLEQTADVLVLGSYGMLRRNGNKLVRRVHDDVVEANIDGGSISTHNEEAIILAEEVSCKRVWAARMHG